MVVIMTDYCKRAASEALAIRSACMICVIVVSESLLATVLFPFVYQMVREFDGVKERYIGLWAGVISNVVLLPLIARQN